MNMNQVEKLHKPISAFFTFPLSSCGTPTRPLEGACAPRWRAKAQPFYLSQSFAASRMSHNIMAPFLL